ncbi:galactose mutarotase-like [Achroia grisella]|uniref:galactose mutarotase-like n=1 Tax=Achroia grisella TaxID=688607 RepID=UPI0027D20211|nr:galactose mutarotase-like [Achroia grisella]XP_059061048.1 galactose mutarotase-like [Achroia grisella]
MVTLSEQPFGTFENEPVRKFTWTTGSGFSVSAISYGAIVQSIKVPDNNGTISDVVLGFDDLQGYIEKNSPHFGSSIGRCANRIGGASFTIDGVEYQLAKNVGINHLHGGIKGFDQAVWKSTVVGTKVVFSYLSRDGEEGYPGDLVTNVTYQVLDDDSFHVTFQSTTTKKTVINLTNHSYFNLAGHDSGAQELYKHVISINADRITETDSESIPTGKFINVGGTPYDLRIPISFKEVMTKQPDLYDDNFCVTTQGNEGLNFISRVQHPPTGRYLELYSNQPGVQLYTSNFLPSPSDPALVGKDGVGYRRHGAFCLETQVYPDAVHQPNFPTSILVPGDVYKHLVIYKFGSGKNIQPAVVSA